MGEDQAPRRHRGPGDDTSPKPASPTRRSSAWAGPESTSSCSTRRWRAPPPWSRAASSTGATAEEIVRSNFGGAAKGFKTITGAKGTKGYRFVDAFDEAAGGIAREAKTGIARLTPFIEEQIRKDVLLRSREGWAKVEWHFFPSARSSTLGPTKELMDALSANGIGWVIHLP